MRLLLTAAVLLLCAMCYRVIAEPPGYADVTDEAQTRKNRSLALLQEEMVPILESLPLIETEAESTRRETKLVAQRAIALCIASVKGEGLEQAIVERLVQEYQIADVLTPDERAFIKNPNPTQHDRLQFSWRYECYWTLLWSLGFVETLARPDKPCDAGVAVSILRDLGREKFFQQAKLRPQAEILDAADLIYRYHWAVTDARINGREAPAGLHGGVVMERHYALNWLIGYQDQAWDDISTDT